MKSNLKKLLALLLAALLALSLTGLSEEEVVIEDGSAAIDEASVDILSPEEGDLAAQLDELELSIPDIDLEAPAIEGTVVPEEISEDEAASNALVKKVVIGVKEKYTINTSSLKGKLTFASAKPAIAAVTRKGVVVGKKVGTTKITITARKKKYTVTVTVRKAPAKVTLKPSEATLEIGDTLQLKAVLPNKTASNKIGWASSNKNVATVSKTGVVTAKAAGTATITVKTFNGKKATCQVTVNEPAPEVTPTPEPTPEIPLITVDKTDISLNVGETYTVQLMYNGNGKIYVSTSVSGIVKCEWCGQWNNRTTEFYFTGIKNGSTIVSVKDDATGYSVPINVTVISSAPTPTPTPEPTLPPSKLTKPIHFEYPRVLESWEIGNSRMETAQEYRIDVFEYDIIPVGGGFKCKLSFGGIKTKDIYGPYNATKYPLNWHLYNKAGFELCGGVIWTPLLTLNDRWYPEQCTTYTNVFDNSIELGNLWIDGILSN